jgi:hypothetical protein
VYATYLLAARGSSRSAALQTALRLVSTLTLPSLILQTVCKYAELSVRFTFEFLHPVLMLAVALRCRGTPSSAQPRL